MSELISGAYGTSLPASELDRLLASTWRDGGSVGGRVEYFSHADFSSSRGWIIITDSTGLEAISGVEAISILTLQVRNANRQIISMAPMPSIDASVAAQIEMLRVAARELPDSDIRRRASVAVETLVPVFAELGGEVLPPCNLAVGDDGAFLMEWTRGGRRIGINVEKLPAESGWYFVSLDPTAPGSASGSMVELKSPELFQRLLR